MMTTIRAARLEVAELQTVGGRGVRLTLTRDANTLEPLELAIESGWLSPAWRPDERRPVLIPAHLMGELIATLSALEATR